MSSSATSSTTNTPEDTPLPDEMYVEHCIFSWSIENFKCEEWDRDEYIRSPLFSIRSLAFSTWCISLKPTVFEDGQQGIELLLQRVQSSHGYGDARVTFRFGLGDPSGNKIWFQEVREVRFVKPDTKVVRSSLFQQLEDFCEDTLIVYCEMYATAASKRKPPDARRDVDIFRNLMYLSLDTSEMKSHSDLANVLFQVKGCNFRLHKSILSARSAAFAWMLQDGNSYIELPDLHRGIMDSIFYYMYSGDLSLTLANSAICIGLYEAAHNLCISGLRESLTPTMITGRTLLSVERSDFVWSIEHFSSRTLDNIIVSPEFSGGFPTAMGWRIALYNNITNPASRTFVGFIIKSTQNGYIRTLMKISLLDKNGRSMFTTSDRKMVAPGGIFVSFFEKSALIQMKDILIPNDILTVYCKLSFVVTKSDITSIVTTSSCNGDGAFYDLKRLSNDLLSIFQSGYLSDIKVDCDDVTFKVHKDILLTRSEIPAMVMTRKVLEIYELDSSVLKLVFIYMYSGILENHPPEVITDVYKAAQRLQMPLLMKQCTERLGGSLKVPLVLDVYCFAASYDEETLRLKCLEFMHAHSRDIFEHEAWTNLESYNPLLAKEIRVLLS